MKMCESEKELTADSYWYLAWLTWKARRFLSLSHGAAIKALVEEACHRVQIVLEDVRTDKSTVLLAVKIPPDVDPGRLIRQLKRFVAAELLKLFPSLKQSLRGESVWADGYADICRPMSDRDVYAAYTRQRKGLGGRLRKGCQVLDYLTKRPTLVRGVLPGM